MKCTFFIQKLLWQVPSPSGLYVTLKLSNQMSQNLNSIWRNVHSTKYLSTKCRIPNLSCNNLSLLTALRSQYTYLIAFYMCVLASLQLWKKIGLFSINLIKTVVLVRMAVPNRRQPGVSISNFNTLDMCTLGEFQRVGAVCLWGIWPSSKYHKVYYAVVEMLFPFLCVETVCFQVRAF